MASILCKSIWGFECARVYGGLSVQEYMGFQCARVYGGLGPFCLSTHYAGNAAAAGASCNRWMMVRGLRADASPPDSSLLSQTQLSQPVGKQVDAGWQKLTLCLLVFAFLAVNVLGFCFYFLLGLFAPRIDAPIHATLKT